MTAPWIELPEGDWETPLVAMNVATGDPWRSSDGALVLEWVPEPFTHVWQAAFAVGVFLRGGAE